MATDNKNNKKKAPYEAPTVHQIKMEQAFGQSNCKTAEPLGVGSNPAGSCDGLIGSPPTTQCNFPGT